jgi:hypothetical protein
MKRKEQDKKKDSKEITEWLFEHWFDIYALELKNQNLMINALIGFW